MANYESPIVLSVVSTTFKTAATLQANARRFMVYEVEFGQSSTPVSTDTQCLWDLSRFPATAGVAGTAQTLQLLDPADVAASTIALVNISTEPTNYTSAGNGLNLKSWAINQRGSYRWRALDDGDNIIVASTASQGVGVRVLSPGYNASAAGNWSIIER